MSEFEWDLSYETNRIYMYEGCINKVLKIAYLLINISARGFQSYLKFSKI